MSSTSHWHPFAHLNLSANPFGELTPSDRAAAAIVDTQRWRDWLADGGRRAVQFIGECGRGKTTHLLALASELKGAHYVYLPPHPLEARRWVPRYCLASRAPLPDFPNADVLVIDEAQRLPRRLRSELLARGLPLVLGTHCNLARPLRSAGYVQQVVSVATSVTAERVHAIMNRRIEQVRIDQGPVPRISVQQSEQLCQQFGDDVRAMEGYLYEQFQQQANTDAENSSSPSKAVS